MRTLYLDCFSGIAGDMMLASLVHAGADREYIENELKKIRIEPFTLAWKTVVKQGVTALKLDVLTEQSDHSHHHRHYADIVDLIQDTDFNDNVKRISLAIFAKIGAAEAKIHNIPLEKVHFHEVGAIDSIVDTIGVALALDTLQIERIVSSNIPLGSGQVKCDHGIYPVPAPATLEMMKGIPLAPSRHAVELTTPTGAGIISALVDEFSPSLPPLIVESIGYGAGTRDLPEQPNVLRTVIGNQPEEVRRAPVQLDHVHTHAHKTETHHHDKH